MSQVNANPEDLRRLRRELVAMKEAATAATAKAKSVMGGVSWNDQVRRGFEQQFNSVVGSINRSAQQVDQLTSVLDSTIAQLDGYLRR